MIADVNKILYVGDYELFILDTAIYNGRKFLLTAEVNQTRDDITDNILILEELAQSEKILVQKVVDSEILEALNPIFAKRLKMLSSDGDNNE